ncbi:MAG TPA: helix-turn-helix domain-containing protein [Mycobacteriales bacterium]|jgi:AcrR family transcriptional regulator|nr:helix-turn-helix domain-containing protein [Mycobacteriales bacterium]
MSDVVKRPYQSRLRAEQALRTRRLIRAAAEELFLRVGYTAASVREIAAAAGVAERTVFAAFPTKLALFQEVLGVATAGDERPVPLRDRPEYAALLAESDGAAVLDAVAVRTRAVMERAGALMMTAVESAGADPDMRRLDRQAAATMRRNMGDVASALHRHGALREGVSDAEAGDVLATLLSPHVYSLLRHRSRWSAARYEAWLAARLKEALLP